MSSRLDTVRSCRDFSDLAPFGCRGLHSFKSTLLPFRINRVLRLSTMSRHNGRLSGDVSPHVWAAVCYNNALDHMFP